MPTVTSADIVSRLKLLADEHLKADSGSTTTTVNSTLIDESDKTNSIICFISGSNIGTDRVITAFDDTTGTITFAALDNAITSLDEFCLVQNGFASDIAQAGIAIKNDFRNMGYDITLFLNSDTQLKELYIYKAIELICAGLVNDGTEEDAYFFNYERFKAFYETERTTLTADYDANEDGTISEDEENVTVNYGILGR